MELNHHGEAQRSCKSNGTCNCRWTSRSAQLAANNNFRDDLASMIGGEVARCSIAMLQVAGEVAKENLWTTESCISRSKATYPRRLISLDVMHNSFVDKESLLHGRCL